MIPKSGNRLSEEIMLKTKRAGFLPQFRAAPAPHPNRL
jgi:hypothetical protein